MSNSLAIAAVTEALRAQLLAVAQNSVPHSGVTVGRPLAQDPVRATVNLYPFGIRFAMPLHSSELPTTGADGAPLRLTGAALTLQLLISFYGDYAKQEPQILMGAVVASMHANPIMDAAETGRVVESVETLRHSDLGQAIESIRLTPSDLAMVDLCKLWSTLQVPHVPSVAYEAGILMIDDRSHAHRSPVVDIGET